LGMKHSPVMSYTSCKFVGGFDWKERGRKLHSECPLTAGGGRQKGYLRHEENTSE